MNTAAGYVPVISPPAIDENDQPVNVDADRAAAALAAALGADQLLLLSGAPGVLADPGDPASVQTTVQISPAGAPDPSATGGMALKLIAAREALTCGVATVRIADGRTPEPVRRALAGEGTTVSISCAEPIPSR
jgi:acetylglutamate/LysW-gamma-L-alpha-aminoadipate kinase